MPRGVYNRAKIANITPLAHGEQPRGPGEAAEVLLSALAWWDAQAEQTPAFVRQGNAYLRTQWLALRQRVAELEAGTTHPSPSQEGKPTPEPERVNRIALVALLDEIETYQHPVYERILDGADGTDEKGALIPLRLLAGLRELVQP